MEPKHSRVALPLPLVPHLPPHIHLILNNVPDHFQHHNHLHTLDHHLHHDLTLRPRRAHLHDLAIHLVVTILLLEIDPDLHFVHIIEEVVTLLIILVHFMTDMYHLDDGPVVGMYKYTLKINQQVVPYGTILIILIFLEEIRLLVCLLDDQDFDHHLMVIMLHHLLH